VPIFNDPGVSRRSGPSVADGRWRLVLRDLSSANGTQLNGKELVPGADTPVKDATPSPSAPGRTSPFGPSSSEESDVTTATPTVSLFARLRSAGAAPTPLVLRAGLAAVWLTRCCALFARHRLDMACRPVGKEAAASIIAAQQIKTDLAAMHCHAARLLLRRQTRFRRRRTTTVGEDRTSREAASAVTEDCSAARTLPTRRRRNDSHPPRHLAVTKP